MNKKIRYKCKENDSIIHVIIEGSKIGELHFGLDTRLMLVIGYKDLKRAIKKAKKNISE